MQGLMQHRRWLWILVIAIIAGGLYGTRSLMGRGEGPLLDRVNAYWEAQRINDLLTRYKMEVRAATGELWPDEYPRVNDYRTRVLEYTINGMEISGDMAKVNLTVRWTMPDWNGQSFKRPQEDIWTFHEGTWYHGELEKGAWKKAHPESVHADPAKVPAKSSTPAKPVNGGADPNAKPIENNPPTLN